MADDLDDGLDYMLEPVIDDGSLILSDNEEDAPYYNNNSEGEDEFTRQEKSSAGSGNLKKRKDRESDKETSTSDKNANKKKKKSNDKFTEKKQVKQQSYADQRRQLATSSPFMVADYLASKVRRRYPDLSTIELGDLYIKEASIAPTEDFESGEERDDEGYPKFMEQYFQDILKEHQAANGDSAPVSKAAKKRNKKKNKKAGTSSTVPPRYILVLASSAIRVCDINRALRNSPFGSFKLIKKNKLGYDVHMFETGKSRIAVATVGRIERLLDMDPKQYAAESSKKDENADQKDTKCLDYSQIAAIVVDSTFLDKKDQHTWDLPETIPFVKKVIDKCIQMEKDQDESSDKIPKVYLY